MTTLARLALAWLAVSVGVTGLSCTTASASVVTRASGFPVSNENSIIVSDDKGTDPGQVNEIAIGLAPDFPDDYRITDTGGIQGQMPELCIRESGNSVRCSTSAPAGSNPDPQQVSRIFVALGGGDDTFSVLDLVESRRTCCSRWRVGPATTRSGDGKAAGAKSCEGT